MVTFIVCVCCLLGGYFIYSKIIEKLVDVDKTSLAPSQTMRDNVDFLPMKKNRNAMINLLNIAGTGPIYGPILGALYGPVALLWIVFGCIFAGAVHDFLIGIISIRNKGMTLPFLAEKYISKNFRHVVNAFAALLLLLVATVFVVGPSYLLNNLIPQFNLKIIIGLIFVYYFISTLLPVDKIIGRIYPILGVVLIISAFAMLVSIFLSGKTLPEMNLQNLHPKGLPIFPLLFLTLSCGALSGFHATQIPIVARTIENESQARYVFYGMMIAEGLIALIWGYATIVILDGQTLLELIQKGTPSLVVNTISHIALGSIIGIIVVLGVIVLPITSGDTAFRSLRLMFAEYFNINQKPIMNRLIVAVPFFIISFILTFIDFQLLWQYFSWANQTLASIALWIATMYLLHLGKNIWYALIPALFITYVVLTYILMAKIGLALNVVLSNVLAGLICLGLLIMVLKYNYTRVR